MLLRAKGVDIATIAVPGPREHPDHAYLRCPWPWESPHVWPGL